MHTKRTFFIDRNGAKETVSAHMLYFPNYVQPNEYSCGTASVLSILRYYGIEDANESQLEKKLKTNPDQWTHLTHILAFLADRDFRTDARKMTIDDIQQYIDRAIPVMVMIQARSEKKTDYAKSREEGHYAVVIGYNEEYLFFDDPVLEHIWYMKKDDFISRRHDYDDQKHIYVHYGIAVYGKKPKYDPLQIEKID